MTETTITFYGGLNGMGVCFCLAYGKDRIISDLGAPFNPNGEIYDGTILRRNKNRVIDDIFLEKAPPIEYLYPKESLEGFDLKAFEDGDYNTAVFISHLHLDHMSEIDKVHPSIPVYIHKDGVKLKKCLEEIGEDNYYRDYQEFEYHQTIEVGEIRVTPFFSDHACIGSAGFLIETPDATVYYSGDIRFHALEYQRAYEELDLVKKNKIDLLIADTTTTSSSEMHKNNITAEELNKPSKDFLDSCITERDIYEDVYAKLNRYPRLGFFNIYHRDIRMLKELIALAEKAGRKAVFEPSTAYIIYKLLNTCPNVIYPDNDLKPAYYIELKEHSNTIAKEDILNNPTQFFVETSYKNIFELTDYDGIKAIYFHLFGEPLTVGEKHYQIMQNFIKKLNWDFSSYLNQYSFSHSYPNNLSYFIQEINAKAIVSVHSKSPEKLNPVNSRQYFLTNRKTYRINHGELEEV